MIEQFSITRNLNGSYTISTIHNGHLFSHTFMGYSKREALRIFRECLKSAA